MKLATFSMSAENANHSFRLAQLAVHYRQLMLVSVVGPQASVRAMLAALSSGYQAQVNARVELEPYGSTNGLHGAYKKGQYHTRTHRLDYDLVHVVAWSKDQTFLPCITEDAVWAELASERYTTPILREWVPWLMGRLENGRRLERLPSFQCRSGLLTATDEDLDKAVSYGVKEGFLEIPEVDDAGLDGCRSGAVAWGEPDSCDGVTANSIRA